MDSIIKTVDKAWQEYDKTVREFYSSQDQVPPLLMDKLQDLDRSVWELRVGIDATRHQITSVHETLIQITKVLTHQN